MLRFFVGFLIDHRFSRYGVTAKGGADAGNLAIARCRVSPTPTILLGFTLQPQTGCHVITFSILLANSNYFRGWERATRGGHGQELLGLPDLQRIKNKHDGTLIRDPERDNAQFCCISQKCPFANARRRLSSVANCGVRYGWVISIPCETN